ncbi:MAG TPA: histidine--tRNA ligase [Ktedonobacterales bacterium]|nr:histidine--tRNA ligase [Ktedonobacterales bacterium]
MARIAPNPVKGTRDYLPKDLVRREHVFGALRSTFERYGYEPLETPVVENTNVLEGKYGEEGERLLFRVLKRGRDLESAVAGLADDRSAGSLSRQLADMALRYDLTIPLSRVIAAHQNEILLPFRRYQMQPVWRADRPQYGRYREFYQCDVDCVGSRSMTVDAEMIAIYNDVFSALGFTDFTVRVNHRGLLAGLMASSGVPPELRVAALTALDKLDKIAEQGVREELTKAGLASDSIERLMEAVALTGTPQAILDALRPALEQTESGQTGLRELTEVFELLSAMGVPVARYALDISIVRGLAYYTGMICETRLNGSSLGSLGGGGRYDQLIGMFLGRDIPAVGVSFGLERIFVAMDEAGLWTDQPATNTQALVALFSPETRAASFALATELRRGGVNTEVYAEQKELGPQLAFASKKGIPVVCLIGPDELARDEVSVRDLRSSEQQAVPRADVVARVKAILGLA